jgi:hypothetical protein
MNTELAHITPAIKTRIEALGYVPGETPANPVAWLVAEAERLQSGGCARDQRTTQYCAEVIGRDAEIASLRAEVERLKVLGPDTEARITIEARAMASDLLAPVTESWRAHAAKIEAERDELRAQLEKARATP